MDDPYGTHNEHSFLRTIDDLRHTEKAYGARQYGASIVFFSTILEIVVFVRLLRAGEDG